MKNTYHQNRTFNNSFNQIRISRGFAFGIIILIALTAFEIFNYSTTQFALEDLLGDLKFLGLPWATILAIAFCCIDFAGLARLNTPEDGSGQPNETWYLFVAWLLGATMNAILTWWAVSLALISRESLGNMIVERSTLLRVVPIFVAILVWIIRVLIIGTFATSGHRLLSQRDPKRSVNYYADNDLSNVVSGRQMGNQSVSASPTSHKPSARFDGQNSTNSNKGPRSRSL